MGITLPENPGKALRIEFTTRDGTLIATSYDRVVIGGRGPYIEFSTDMIVLDNLEVKPDETWRLTYGKCYYVDYRSRDRAWVKVYRQKRRVSYADYKVGKWYVSPSLVLANGEQVDAILKDDGTRLEVEKSAP